MAIIRFDELAYAVYWVGYAKLYKRQLKWMQEEMKAQNRTPGVSS